MEDKFEGYKSVLTDYEAENRLRAIPIDRESPSRIDLSGNDYLGLAARREEFQRDFMNRCDAAFTSSASRLLASRQKHYQQLEQLLQELYGNPALLFNSGYHANVGCISALNIKGTVFLCDKLIHASVI